MNPWYIAIGVLGGVIITGIISLVLIKLILMIMVRLFMCWEGHVYIFVQLMCGIMLMKTYNAFIQDRVEYKKFAKHLAEANWAQVS